VFVFTHLLDLCEWASHRFHWDWCCWKAARRHLAYKKSCSNRIQNFAFEGPGEPYLEFFAFRSTELFQTLRDLFVVKFNCSLFCSVLL